MPWKWRERAQENIQFICRWHGVAECGKEDSVKENVSL